MFRRAIRLFNTISGREEYTDPSAKFENVSMLLFQPQGSGHDPWATIVNRDTNQDMTEPQYFELLRVIYNEPNPHAMLGEEAP